MKRLLKLAALLVIPGAFIVAAIFLLRSFMAIREAVVTGDPRFDQFQSRLSVAILVKGLPYSMSVERAKYLGRALMAILHNENLTGWDGTSPVVGDVDAPGGPSIGPMQVYRATAIDLGLVPTDETREAYAARAQDVNWCIEAGVIVFFSKLNAVGGDISEAIRAYNGSGPHAVAYKENALSWLMSTYGENPIGV